MKFTWGHGVTVGFALFVIYILSFVYRSFNENIDLVAEDYYAQEVVFQNRIDQVANGEAFKDQIVVENSADQVRVSFPQELNHQDLSGTLYFFRPSNKALDLRIPIQLNENAEMQISKLNLTQGRYKLEISWHHGEKDYFITKDLTI